MKLTVTEAARLLAVPEHEVYVWMRTRGLPYVRIQDQHYIHRARLHAWAREHYVPLDPDVFEHAAGSAPGDELADALHRGQLHPLAEPPNTRAGAEAIVEALHLPDAGDAEVLSAVMAARPSLGVVIDRDGIAVPRLGEPVLFAGPPALHVYAFEPPWRIGGSAVRRLFLIVAPTVAIHHRLLADLDAALNQPAFRKALTRWDTHEALVDVVRSFDRGARSVAAK